MRLDLAISHEEKRAAYYLAKLAAAVEQAGYYCAEGNPPDTQKQLEKAYRVLRPACEFFTEDHGLIWQPSDGKFFRKKVKP
jgi:hypothetical protein